MDTPKKNVLNEQELRELREGQALFELTKSPGFLILKKWLEGMAFHSWVDPRAAESQKEWVWQELNAYHAATVARELLEEIQKGISRSEYLGKKSRGELSTKPMKI